MTSETVEREPTEQRRRTNPITFFKEVRAEGRKVTWATRQEVTVSTIMVVIFVIVAAIFFFVVDQIIGFLITLILPGR